MAREKLTRYDTVDYLESEEDILAYLRAAIEEGGDDPAFLAAALGNVGRARGMVQLAKDTGLTRVGLYKALGVGGNPTLGTAMKVIRALGFKLSLEPAKKPARMEAPRRRAAKG